MPGGYNGKGKGKDGSSGAVAIFASIKLNARCRILGGAMNKERLLQWASDLLGAAIIAACIALMMMV
jgi:hypothetical protein